MLYRVSIIDKLVEGRNTDPQVLFNKKRGDLAVAFSRLYTFWNHRLIRDEKQGARGYLVGETGDEDRSRLHVDGHTSKCFKVLFEGVVMLPNPSVGGIDRSRPIILIEISDCCRYGFLEAEGGQGRNYRREVIIGSSFPSDGCNRQDQVSNLVFLLQSTAFPQKQTGLRLDAAKQVHYSGGIGTTDTEIDDGDVLGRGTAHGFALANHFHLVPLGEKINIQLKIGQQDVVSEIFKFFPCITGQPVIDDFFFGLHAFLLFFLALASAGALNYFCKVEPDSLELLNFPDFSFRVRAEGQSKQIFDCVRKRFVRLTPEEWVRQNLIRFMEEVHRYPVSRMAVEKKVEVNGLSQRADLVVYDSNGKPWLIAECKAPRIEIGEDAFLQAVRYNQGLKVPYVLLTNGIEHFCLKWSGTGFDFVDSLPLAE